MVTSQIHSRKSRFRAALILADMTAGEWTDRHGYTETHLSLVLNGKRESLTLCEKIDAFADSVIRKAAARAA